MDIGKLTAWNPWWEELEGISQLKGMQRPAYKDLKDSMGIREVTIITGIRRSGKSTLMYQMIDHLLEEGVGPEQILFVNLEDKRFADDSLDDIYTAYRKEINLEKKAYVFLDEIHRKDSWESWIRRRYDQKTDDKFVISGSCSYLLKKEYSTLLTGRNLAFEIFPLGFGEFLLFKGVGIDKGKLRKGVVSEKTRLAILKELDEYLRLGGFPEILFKPENFKERVLAQYFDDILYKDIIDRYDLNSQKAKDLALYLMTNFTSAISLRNLRNALGISYDTIKDYLSYYKEAFLFFVIDHFSYSIKEQKTLASKIYCIDNGLRNTVSFKFSQDAGRLAENCVLVELKRRDADVYYWSKRGEVDFVVKGKDGALTALNVSYTDEIDEREAKALLEFKEAFGKKAGKLVLITKGIEKRENGIEYVPLWRWLLLS